MAESSGRMLQLGRLLAAARFAAYTYTCACLSYFITRDHDNVVGLVVLKLSEEFE